MDGFITFVSRCREDAITDYFTIAVCMHCLDAFDAALMGFNVADQGIRLHVPYLQALESCRVEQVADCCKAVYLSIMGVGNRVIDAPGGTAILVIRVD